MSNTGTKSKSIGDYIDDAVDGKDSVVKEKPQDVKVHSKSTGVKKDKVTSKPVTKAKDKVKKESNPSLIMSIGKKYLSNGTYTVKELCDLIQSELLDVPYATIRRTILRSKRPLTDPKNKWGFSTVTDSETKKISIRKDV